MNMPIYLKTGAIFDKHMPQFWEYLLFFILFYKGSCSDFKL